MIDEDEVQRAGEETKSYRAPRFPSNTKNSDENRARSIKPLNNQRMGTEREESQKRHVAATPHMTLERRTLSSMLVTECSRPFKPPLTGRFHHQGGSSARSGVSRTCRSHLGALSAPFAYTKLTGSVTDVRSYGRTTRKQDSRHRQHRHESSTSTSTIGGSTRITRSGRYSHFPLGEVCADGHETSITTICNSPVGMSFEDVQTLLVLSNQSDFPLCVQY